MFVALALLSTTRGKESETRGSAPTKARKTEVVSGPPGGTTSAPLSAGRPNDATAMGKKYY